MWPLLVRSLSPYRRLLVGVVVFQVAQSAALLVLPALNADIIDRGLVQGETGVILSLGSVMLALTVVQIACALLAVYLAARVAMSVGRDLRSEVFVHVGTFSEREMTRFGTATLITRTTNDVQQVQVFVLTACTMLVSAPILSIGGVVLALREDVALSAVLAVAVPVLLVGVLLVVVRMVPLFQQQQGRLDSLNAVLREQLTGIRTVRAFVREPFESSRFDEATSGVYDAALRAGRLFALVFPVVQVVLNASSVAVVWFGAQRIDAGAMQVGSLTAFLTYLAQILAAVTMATFVVVLLPRASVSAGRITEVLDARTSVVAPSAPVTDLAPTGRVELRGVGFTYPGAHEPVLSEISFVAERGTTAVVGATGSGKTTLVNLVARLLDATAGTVLVDGVDVREVDPGTLWSRFGIVPQTAYLFSGTVGTNVRLGCPEATDEQVWAALATAQAEGFVRAMPHGLDTPVAQGGGTMSGGQRQRIAIARALVARPQIVVLDDSSSALDTTTDADLRAALRRDVPEATFLVVAQRVSSIVSADQIVVVDAGTLVAAGTHEELLATSPVYADIVATQQLSEARS